MITGVILWLFVFKGEIDNLPRPLGGGLEQQNPTPKQTEPKLTLKPY